MGGYFKNSDIIKINDTHKFGFLMFLIGVIIVLVYSGMFICNYNITDQKYFFNENGIPVVIMSLGLFRLFICLKVKLNYFLRNYGGSCLAIYLIHDNRYLNPLVWAWVDADSKFSAVGGLAIGIVIFLLAGYLDLLVRIIFGNSISKIAYIGDEVYEKYVLKDK